MMQLVILSLECADPSMCAEFSQQQQELVVTYATYIVYVVTTIIVGLLGYDVYTKKKEMNEEVGV